MDRTNVSTVLVAGKLKKWRGKMLGFDVPKLRRDLEASRDYLFRTTGIERDLFRV